MGNKEYKILIIDHDHNEINFLNTCFAQLQFKVFYSENIDDAKIKILNVKPDLLITDIVIKNENGIELIEWSEANSKNTKSILAINEIHDISAHQSSKYEILVKPFHTEDLDIIIKKLFPELIQSKDDLSLLEKKFLEISFDQFITGTKASMSLYLKLSSSKFVKIIHKGELVDTHVLDKYRAKGVKAIYVEKIEYDNYLQLGIKAIDIIKDKKNISSIQKTKFFIHVSDAFQEKLYKSSFNQDDFNEAAEFVSTSLEVVSKNKSIFDLFDLLKTNPNLNYAHSLAVSTYSVLLGKKLHWTTDKTMNILAIGGFMHDIGKKNLPEELIKKSHKDYTADEIKIWENHTIAGAEFLTRTGDIPKEVFQIVIQHHECVDGTGFPFGLSNVNIFPLAKIVGLIDCFTNLVLAKDGEKSLSPKEALHYIQNNLAEKYDPKMTDELARLIIK